MRSVVRGLCDDHAMLCEHVFEKRVFVDDPDWLLLMTIGDV